MTYFACVSVHNFIVANRLFNSGYPWIYFCIYVLYFNVETFGCLKQKISNGEIGIGWQRNDDMYLVKSH